MVKKERDVRRSIRNVDRSFSYPKKKGKIGNERKRQETDCRCAGNGIYVSGTLTVESGQFDETAALHALGTIRINGGTIAYLSTAGGEGTKIIDVYGGTIAQLDALDQGTANIYGG